MGRGANSYEDFEAISMQSTDRCLVAQHSNEHGFTLIELLVVLAIISLMISLLLPSITRAQKQGEGIHCLGNQRQLLLAWIQYATDADDLLCDPKAFKGKLEPYIKTADVFTCKSIEAHSGGESRRREGGYAVSNTMAGEQRDEVQPFVKLHHVTFPSSRLVCLDVEPGSGSPFWPLVWEPNEWLWRPWSWPPSSSMQGITDRHGNGCNLGFADGHSEPYHWHDTRTLQLIKGQIADSEEASRENVDLAFMVDILVRDKAKRDGLTQPSP